MIIVLFGPPGSGKGSQAQLLVSKYNFFNISTGDLLREQMSLKTHLGEQIKNVLEEGALVSDDIISTLCFEKILNNDKRNLILDGFPRTLGQAVKINQFLAKNNLKIDLVLYFDVDLVKLEQRIVGRFSCSKCGEVYHDSFKTPHKKGVCDICGNLTFIKRSDDNLDVLKNRISTYLRETYTLKEYYEGQNILTTIDASCDMNLVNENIINCLNQAGFKK